MSDLARAKEILLAGSYTCVLCRGEDTLTSSQRGIAPLMDWLSAKQDLTGYSAVDQVVGRAAALLYAASGVKQVHALLASTGAQAVLAAHHIDFSSDELVPQIMNRSRDASCPMELAVTGVDDPGLAVPLLQEALSLMRSKALA